MQNALKLMNIIKVNKYLNALKQFIFPFRCLGCGFFSDRIICDTCLCSITFIKAPYCHLCAIHLGQQYNNICAACFKNPPLFSKARAAILYNENSRSIIKRFKFNDAIHSANIYAQWMMAAGHDILSEADLIVPVPLHRVKLLSRGYNQSSLIANIISQHTNIEVDHLALCRVKNTLSQSQLPFSQRRLSNVNNAFVVRKAENIKNKKIILVDDVITTGATVLACTKILMRSKAHSVNILTLSRANHVLLR